MKKAKKGLQLNKVIFTIIAVIVVLLLNILCLTKCDPKLLWFRNDTEQLMKAIKKEDISKIEKLLQNGLDPNLTDIPPSKVNSFFESSARRPLSEACSTGNYEIVELLINYGATAEYIEYTDWSPLHAVLHHYHTDDVKMLKLLLKNGADPNNDFATKAHPVFRAAEMRPRNHDMPIEDRQEYDPVAAEEITEIVKILLGTESVNIKDTTGQSLLFPASLAGNLYLVEYLLQAGCDPNIRDVSGETALEDLLRREEDGIIVANKDIIALLSQVTE